MDPGNTPGTCCDHRPDGQTGVANGTLLHFPGIGFPATRSETVPHRISSRSSAFYHPQYQDSRKGHLSWRLCPGTAKTGCSNLAPDLEKLRIPGYLPPMSVYHPISSWQDSASRLIAVATGRDAADLVLRNCRWVNVQSREVLDGHDIAVADGRFAYCGPDASHCIGDGTELLDAEGMFAIPGLCDGHMHVESGLLTPARFAEAVIPHGTTTMFTDPHEIANVLGLDGVRLMHDEAMLLPVGMYLNVPSCAPFSAGPGNVRC